MSENDLSKVSGPDNMAKPTAGGSSQAATQNTATSSTAPNTANGSGAAPKKKRHRAGKNRKKRRQSFVAPSETEEGTDAGGGRPSLLDMPNPRQSTQQASFYRLNQGARSNTSLESEALLDHREHGPPTSRRRSNTQGFGRPSMPFARSQHRSSQTSAQPGSAQKPRFNNRPQGAAISEDDEEGQDSNDRTPLLSRPNNFSRPAASRAQSGNNNYGSSHAAHRQRRSSGHSKNSFKQKIDIGSQGIRGNDLEDNSDYDVNNPPSMPGSPRLGSLDDVMKPDMPTSFSDRGRDAIIDVDFEERDESSPEAARRRHTVADMAERDVCFPVDGGISEMGDEEEDRRTQDSSRRSRRRRAKQWPDLEVLDEFSREEKEERTQQEYIRAKKISEPVMVGGRLRPRKSVWHREEDDAPFRFTYFSEKLDGTIHARNIGDLIQDGGSFQELFRPNPEEVSDDSETEDEEDNGHGMQRPMERPSMLGMNGRSYSMAGSKAPATEASAKRSESGSKPTTGDNTPSNQASQAPTPIPSKPRASKRYGPRPTFWLDVMKPTEIEMKVLAKTFGIHQLTIEDILMDEPREKVELFQSYYFVNYRSFEQDKDNDDYMEPINMYVVVFRDGVITFHHSMTPHPANVRRRIRQLNDYMSPTADWVSYAIIDDVTDVYAPLVQQIEEEVDNIDDEILYMHQHSADDAVGKEKKNSKNEKNGGQPGTQGDMGAVKAQGEKTAGESGGDMLRRVGECRKKVMGLYRLLGNKADVIKGFAKRCNEHWDVAPRSEIGLYLGDIQDHIVTMTGNLSHYESLLSRAHSNYLAQINIRMNERAEQTADVLGKLTVLGTIVLPMNIVTGMWGMNVYVPGQAAEDNLTWFWCITAGLLGFGLGCYFIAKRVYGIV